MKATNTSAKLQLKKQTLVCLTPSASQVSQPTIPTLTTVM